MNKNLKLYVWTDVFTDYTSGIAFALATSPDKARELIAKKMNLSPNSMGDLACDPQVITKAEGFGVWGGG